MCCLFVVLLGSKPCTQSTSTCYSVAVHRLNRAMRVSNIAQKEKARSGSVRAGYAVCVHAPDDVVEWRGNKYQYHFRAVHTAGVAHRGVDHDRSWCRSVVHVCIPTNHVRADCGVREGREGEPCPKGKERCGGCVDVRVVVVEVVRRINRTFVVGDPLAIALLEPR